MEVVDARAVLVTGGDESSTFPRGRFAANATSTGVDAAFLTGFRRDAILPLSNGRKDRG